MGGVLFLGGFSLNLDLTGAVLFHIELVSRRTGKIDDAVFGKGATVIDSDLDLLAIFEVGHFGLGPHRQTRMGGCHLFLVKGLAIGGFLALKSWAVP